MSNRKRLWLCLASLGTIGVLSGCGPAPSLDKQRYVLDPSRAGQPVATSQEAVLEIRRFKIDSAFRGKSFVYRTGDLEYETDFYHEFLVSPATMVREAARNWLAQSHRFVRVIDAGGDAEPTYALEADITALYGDSRDADAPKAVMEMRVFFLKVHETRDSELLFSQVYTESTPAVSPGPEGLVVAFNTSLQSILNRLESDLAGTL